jgi:hypothetical protein
MVRYQTDWLHLAYLPEPGDTALYQLNRVEIFDARPGQ